MAMTPRDEQTSKPSIQRQRRSRLLPVERWSDVPAFANEAEEAEYWATHELAGEALESLGRGGTDLLPEPPEAFARPASEPRTRPVAIRLDRDILSRLRAIAGRKNKGYQTLLKEFIVERLYEEEKREGIIAS